LLDVNRGNQPLLPEILEKVTEIMQSGRFIGGPYCDELETLVAGECDASYAIGCASGSDALLLALMAIDLQPGDEVIVPSFTFFASVSAITRLGGRPVFIDINPGTYNLDPQLLEGLVSERTRAIMPVHLFGQCADMQAVQDVASRHGLRIIEDAAQAIGASFQGKRAGGMGDLGCISFYPTKNLGGFGDGGMVTTNDPELADRVRLLANHGMRPRYYHTQIGINSRLDAIQAAVLGVKLGQLPRYTVRRAENALAYRKRLTARGLSTTLGLPECDPRCGHVWNQFTIRVGPQRDAIREQLAAQGIGSEVYYPVPVHLQECYRDLGYHEGSLPATEQAAREVLSLPVFPELTETEIEWVVDALTEIARPALPRRMTC
jgi:dTDP-4-amino-4,6-dideoxygalactose transaminase